MLEKYSKIGISVILLLTIFSFIPIHNLKFEFSFEKFFPVDDPDLAFYKAYKERFHTSIDEEYIFIGLKNKHGIFDQKFLEKVDSLSRFVSGLHNILRVYSVTHTGYVYLEDGKLKEGPIIHISEPVLYEQDSIDLFGSDEYRSLLIGKDGKSVAITAFNAPNLRDTRKDSILEKIQDQMLKMNFDVAHLTAKIRIERTYVNEIEKNLKIYLLISFILSGLVLLMLFRSVRGVVVPILTTVIGICWTLALISIMDYPVDIISSLIPPVLAVIGLSSVVHLITKYLEELNLGLSKTEALKKSMRAVGLATFISSLTTAVGFYSLCVSNILPIRYFGFFAGTGVLLAFIIALGLVLPVYSITSVPNIVRSSHLNQRWIKFLSTCFRGLIKYKYLIIGVFITTIVISVIFTTRIQVNSSMLQEIPKHNPILADYQFIENQFAGTRPFEMALLLKDKKDLFLNLRIMHEIEEVERFLKDSCGLGFLISPVSFIKGANKAFKGGGKANYAIPMRQQDVYRYFDKIMFTGWGKDLLRFLTPDAKYARISGKLPDLTTKEFEAVSNKLNNFFKDRSSSFEFNYKLTGSAILIDKISYSLTRNMLMGLFIAFCIISMIVGFMFRSVRMIFIVLIPNMIPIIVMAATMAFTGISLKADTSIIFAVAFGIVVDDTIHYISRFKHELSKGRTVAYAVKRAYLSTGKAMIFTTLILLAGFMSLLFSSFNGTFYIGFLVSLSLAVALLSDLTLLPLLIIFFYQKK